MRKGEKSREKEKTTVTAVGTVVSFKVKESVVCFFADSHSHENGLMFLSFSV